MTGSWRTALRLIRSLRERAAELVKRHWATIERVNRAVSGELMRHGKLSRREIVLLTICARQFPSRYLVNDGSKYFKPCAQRSLQIAASLSGQWRLTRRRA